MNNQSYEPPSWGATLFSCPNCVGYCSHRWLTERIKLPKKAFEEVSTLNAVSVSICSGCEGVAVWVDFKLVYPAPLLAPSLEPHKDLPSEFLKDYHEARSILIQSPRASAALIRLVLEKLLLHLHGNESSIYNAIGGLVKAGKLSSEAQRACDICRVIGNHAVHPGSIDLDEDPVIASKLFELLNFIVEEAITKPRLRDALFEGLPEKDKASIAKRNAKNLPQ